MCLLFRSAVAASSEPVSHDAGDPEPAVAQVINRPSRRRRRADVVLTVAQQELIAQMLQEEEYAFYYDKGRMAYRDAPRLEELNAALAGAVGLTGNSISHSVC